MGFKFNKGEVYFFLCSGLLATFLSFFLGFPGSGDFGTHELKTHFDQFKLITSPTRKVGSMGYDGIFFSVGKLMGNFHLYFMGKFTLGGQKN